jgi:hypothetical protein
MRLDVAALSYRSGTETVFEVRARLRLDEGTHRGPTENGSQDVTCCTSQATGQLQYHSSGRPNSRASFVHSSPCLVRLFQAGRRAADLLEMQIQSPPWTDR